MILNLVAFLQSLAVSLLCWPSSPHCLASSALPSLPFLESVPLKCQYYPASHYTSGSQSSGLGHTWCARQSDGFSKRFTP